MKTIKLKLYTVKELSKEAREKAYGEFRADNKYEMLGEFMIDNLLELLKENKISLPDNSMPKVSYSLSNCQGDGAMFYGDFEWKKYNVRIEQSGRYSHSNSKTIEISTHNEGENASEKAHQDFEKIYQTICKELERYGYDFIETEDSEESFIEACEANDWTFEADGIMRNN